MTDAGRWQASSNSLLPNRYNCKTFRNFDAGRRLDRHKNSGVGRLAGVPGARPRDSTPGLVAQTCSRFRADVSRSLFS